MPIRSKFLTLPLLLGLAGAVQATEECATVVQCNQVGSVAYQDGRHEQRHESVRCLEHSVRLPSAEARV